MKIYIERKNMMKMKKFDFYFSIVILLTVILFLCVGFLQIGIAHGRKLQTEEDYHISNYFKKELEKAKRQLQNEDISRKEEQYEKILFLL